MPTNLDAVANRCKDIQNGQFKKTVYFKFKEGANLIRILPPFGDREVPFVEFKKVFNLGPNKSQVTPRSQFGLTDCPYEQYYNELAKRTDEASRKELDSIRLKNRVAFIIIDRNDEEVGPQDWETNLECLAEIGALMTNPEWGDISDPLKGVDLQIIYTPKNKTPNGFPEWRITPQRHSTPLTADAAKMESWLGVDWFKEFRVGEASTVEWINAVLTGQEKTFREDGGSAGAQNRSQASAPVGPQSLPDGPPGIASAMSDFPFDPAQPFWAFIDGAAKQVTAQNVYQLVCSGNDVQCCQLGENTWVAASSLGFKKPAPAAPPAPPAAPPAPPTMSGPPAPPSNGAAKEAPPWENIPPTSVLPTVNIPDGGNSVADDIRRQLVGSGK